MNFPFLSTSPPPPPAKKPTIEAPHPPLRAAPNWITISGDCSKSGFPSKLKFQFQNAVLLQVYLGFVWWTCLLALYLTLLYLICRGAGVIAGAVALNFPINFERSLRVICFEIHICWTKVHQSKDLWGRWIDFDLLFTIIPKNLILWQGSRIDLFTFIMNPKWCNKYNVVSLAIFIFSTDFPIS